MNGRDDAHQRWQGQSPEAQAIWQHYDQVVAPQIIKNALAKGCHLHELYQVLSVARTRCEAEKNARVEMTSITRIENFGAFQPGGSEEINIIGWGQVVRTLLYARRNDLLACGLSTVQIFHGSLSLSHPRGFVLEKLDTIFQKLIATNNFFEFVKLAGQLMYSLANFPPITRGSAAVNTWLIDGIARERFNLTDSIRPLLYDWTAFFETPEQYQIFFVTTAVVKYIQTIPLIYATHREFFDAIPELMIKNPNLIENLQERKNAWDTMQAYIAKALETKAFTDEQASCLTTIMQGTLSFREPSAAIKRLVKVLQNAGGEKSINEIALEAQYPLASLRNLIHLNENIRGIYLAMNDDEVLHTNWADLELLRAYYTPHLLDLIKVEPVRPQEATTVCTIILLAIDPTTLSRDDLKIKLNEKPTIILHNQAIYYVDNNWIPILIASAPSNEYIKLLKDHELALNEPKDTITWEDLEDLFDFIPRPTRFTREVNFFRSISFATWQDIEKMPVEVLTLLTPITAHDTRENAALKSNLQEAIWHGGIRIQDLAGLNPNQIQAVTSPAALAEYKKNVFVRAGDLLHTSSTLVGADEKEREKPPTTQFFQQEPARKAKKNGLSPMIDNDTTSQKKI